MTGQRQKLSLDTVAKEASPKPIDCSGAKMAIETCF